jgi:hypothetical protein
LLLKNVDLHCYRKFKGKTLEKITLISPESYADKNGNRNLLKGIIHSSLTFHWG